MFIITVNYPFIQRHGSLEARINQMMGIEPLEQEKPPAKEKNKRSATEQKKQLASIPNSSSQVYMYLMVFVGMFADS